MSLAQLTQPDAVLSSRGDQSSIRSSPELTAASHQGIFSFLILTVCIMYQFYLSLVVNGLLDLACWQCLFCLQFSTVL